MQWWADLWDDWAKTWGYSQWEWGSAADWFAALGTIGALFAALWVLRTERTRSQRENAELVIIRAEVTSGRKEGEDVTRTVKTRAMPEVTACGQTVAIACSHGNWAINARLTVARRRVSNGFAHRCFAGAAGPQAGGPSERSVAFGSRRRATAAPSAPSKQVMSGRHLTRSEPRDR